MRMHDRLMTETPVPNGGDDPFTIYAETFQDDTQVIDATDVLTMFMEVERNMLEEAIREDRAPNAATYFAERFIDWDFSLFSMNLPPFEKFVMEFDAEHSIEATRVGAAKRDAYNMGQFAVACVASSPQDYLDVIHLTGLDPDAIDVAKAIKLGPDIRYILAMSVFSQVPLRGIKGPILSYTVCVNSDGTLATGKDGLPLTLVGPSTPLPGEAKMDRMLEATQWAYLAIIPTLLALNFMNTPRGEKGYHYLTEKKPSPKPNKHFQRKNFRNLTSWHVLDITPLREEVRRTLGRNPESIGEIKQAMHVVRGNTATYAPNTYFGRKHENPITVFRPAHKRGDISIGKVDKDYRLKGAS